jgi:hypothetical protein
MLMSSADYRDRDGRDSMNAPAMDWSLPSSGISSRPARQSGMPTPPTTVRTTKTIRTLMAADQIQAPPDLRQALDVISQHVDDYINRAPLGKAV